MVIAFGTMFSLDEKRTLDLAEAISGISDVGFIMSLKPEMPGYWQLKKLTNVKIDSFIPQQQLLC